jgi:hypothetical protein
MLMSRVKRDARLARGITLLFVRAFGRSEASTVGGRFHHLHPHRLCVVELLGLSVIPTVTTCNKSTVVLLRIAD